MDWKQACKGFENFLLIDKSLSNNTKLAYLHDVKLLQDYLEEKMKEETPAPAELKIVHVQDFIHYLNEEKHIEESDRCKFPNRQKYSSQFDVT
jgi:site-specific recombinase XerD